MNTETDIIKIRVDILNMERKILLLESMKNDENQEKIGEIDLLDEEIIEIEKKVGYYEGKDLKELNFWQLNEIEDTEEKN
jgi:hypothetical protein